MPMFKVVHRSGDVETVYLVDAPNGRDARDEIVETFGVHRGECSATQYGGPLKLYSLNRKTGELNP